MENLNRVRGGLCALIPFVALVAGVALVSSRPNDGTPRPSRRLAVPGAEYERSDVPVPPASGDSWREDDAPPEEVVEFGHTQEDGLLRLPLATLMEMSAAELRAVLHRSSDPLELGNAVFALGNRRTLGPEDAGALADLVMRVADERLQESILSVLRRVPGGIPHDTVTALLQRSAFPSVRAAAARALASDWNSSVETALTESLTQDPSAEVRACVLWHLAAQASERVRRETLLRAVESDSDLQVRRTAINLMGTRSDSWVPSVLEDILYRREMPEALRLEALEALSCSGASSALARAAWDESLPSMARRRAAELMNRDTR